MYFKTAHGTLGLAALLACQALACGSVDGMDPSGSDAAHPPEWDSVGVNVSENLPGTAEAAPTLVAAESAGDSGVGVIEQPIFTPQNPAGSRSRQRGSLWLCFDAGGCCSASFLNNNSILTAAHCLPQPNRNALHGVTMKYEMPNGTIRNWTFRNSGTDARMFFYPHPNQTQSNPNNVSPQWDIAVGNVCAAGAACNTTGVNFSFGLSSDHFVTFLDEPPWDGMNMTAFGSGGPENGVKRAMRIVADDVNSNDLKWVRFAPVEYLCQGDSGAPAMRSSGYSDANGNYWMTQAGVISSGNSNVTVTRADGSTVKCGDSGMASRVRGKQAWIQSITEFWSPTTCKHFTNPIGEPATWCWATP